MSQPTPAEVRAAASYLKKRKLAPLISPRLLASAAKEQGKGFAEIVKFIMRIFQGQTNQPQQRAEVIRAAAGVKES